MKAVVWHGKQDLRVDNVPDPSIVNPHDAIVRVTSTAICGSDLHLYNGFIPAMKPGDIIGHEFMGEIVATGPACETVKVGERVIVMCGISCGRCWFCKHELFSACDNTNPAGSQAALETLYGHAGGALFGYSHLYGGYAGGQAEYVRVPFADVGCVKIPAELSDEQVLFLTDIFPTGFMAAENCKIQLGDTIAVFGAGPVGQFAVKSAYLLGAERVIVIDAVSERLAMAAQQGAIIVDERHGDVIPRIEELTGGRGPDSVIDAVGLEAHGTGVGAVYDKVKQVMRLETDRTTALRNAIMVCRKGGTVSIPGVYGGLVDKFPIGAAFAKGLSFAMGQTHFHRYAKPLLAKVQAGEIDPRFIVTHRIALAEIPAAYKMFNDKQDGCIKVVAKVGT
ncbi:MAG: glutathione-dependent formaldehyde dehydrogenase [Deltaproteobacteria bacterium]|nr:glutathione-dependent formaldehyde dehydrogenase [Deltaproteobacteria bacterium]MDQ3297692.1 glutathione-dependent formaldehyde dehydrogenase [Myxococcota bacterium]